MENDERQYIIVTLMKLPLRAFYGTLEDYCQLQEIFTLRIGIDDKWLNKMYAMHVQVIGECFTCLSKTNPMRLIKLDEETIRIICDSCRENLHSAKPN